MKINYKTYPQNKPNDKDICVCYCPDNTPLEYYVVKYINCEFKDEALTNITEYVESYAVIE
jgi:hypothetical protein